jgi:hypothetical protein
LVALGCFQDAIVDACLWGAVCHIPVFRI